LLTDLANELEPALERAAALEQGQLALLARDTESDRLSNSAINTARWASEVLDPLSRLLHLASSPPYFVMQDDIQKRIISDLQNQVRDLQLEVDKLKDIAIQQSHPTAN
jgi:hypothetical protein